MDRTGAARMVDVTGKEPTARAAVATGVLRTTAEFPGPGVARSYQVTVKHDTPPAASFCCFFLALLAAPLWAAARRSQFETRRWADSNLSS